MWAIRKVVIAFDSDTYCLCTYVQRKVFCRRSARPTTVKMLHLSMNLELMVCSLKMSQQSTVKGFSGCGAAPSLNGVSMLAAEV